MRHLIFAMTEVDGQWWATCACGYQIHDSDHVKAWSMISVHVYRANHHRDVHR